MNRYTSEELDWLKQNYSVLGSHACANHLSRSLSSIRQTANHLGCYVPLSLRNELHSKSLIKGFTSSILPEVFSNVNTKETAYVMGILWADGWVQNKNDYSINIKLIKEDFISILPIFNTLGVWKQYEYYPKNRKPTIQLRCSGKSLVDVFLSFGYHNKSYLSASEIISKIPSELKKYWWRGYFDGDGHIHATHPYRIEFASAWNQDWSFLPHEFPFKITITKGKHSYSKATLCSITEIVKFGNFMWSDWDGIGLLRKYNEFKKLF